MNVYNKHIKAVKPQALPYELCIYYVLFMYYAHFSSNDYF